MELRQEEVFQLPVQEIFEKLLVIGNFSAAEMKNINLSQIPIYRQLEKLCAEEKKLTFILPAFPAKSSNPNKTSGVLPDLGELIALQELNHFCADITKIYKPGAEIIICSDGRVFNDLVFVGDQELKLYKDKINHMIKTKNLKHLKTFDLEDYYSCDTFSSMRQLFCLEHGEELDDLKQSISQSTNLQGLFNGIHRFIKEDFKVANNELSNNQIHKQSKDIAYRVIRRSRAWDKLLSSVFPQTLRLSIHPYPITHHKFGVKLVPSSNRWATPWHNVVVKENAQYQLMKKKEALNLGCVEKLWGGEYAYFERA